MRLAITPHHAAHGPSGSWVKCPACQQPTTKPTGNIRTLEKLILIEFSCAACEHHNQLQISAREWGEQGARIDWLKYAPASACSDP